MAIPPRSRGTARARAPHSPIARTVQLPLQRYLHTEGVSGAVLVGAAAAGLLWANSPWADAYETLWTLPVHAVVGPWRFEHDVRHVVNDGLMAIFFFVVGLEIKRELVEGALSDRRRATLPAAAAVGGMVVPAAIYLALARSGPGVDGWGIPMATDIAFALAVLSLTPARHEVKVLLLALAIVDDIGAILVIAVFYTAAFSWTAAAVAVAAVLVVLGMQRAGVNHIGVYAPVALLFWVAVLESGVHATIAGVILGALTPARAVVPQRTFVDAIGALGEELAQATEGGDRDRAETLAAQVEELSRQSEPPLERAERLFHPWSSYVILPLFALANTGVVLSGDAVRAAIDAPVSHGVLFGLLAGKPLGIVTFGWAAERAGIASRPPGLRWPDVAAVGVLGGIGFTVSIFITDLAFADPALVATAKIAIFAASVTAAAAGWFVAGARPPGARSGPHRTCGGVGDGCARLSNAAIWSRLPC